ncbi:MAG: NAD(P)H-dependent oxidoreductase [Elusimicrobiota bacterium]
MQILILYYSRSGNTEKLAREIAIGAGEVEGVEVIVRSASEVSENDFVSSAGIIAGSPVYFGTMAAELKQVFDRFVTVRRKMEDKVGAAFATSGGDSGGKETTVLSILQAMYIYGMITVGDPMAATGHYGVSCVGAPGEEISSQARLLGKRVSSLAKKLEN